MKIDWIINCDGTITSTDGVEKKIHTSRTGYKRTYWEGKNKYVHRLVAKKYIPNPKNLCCVNHKDGNKINNNVNNLEWCTHKQNIQHGYDTGLYLEKQKETRKLSNDEKEEVFKLRNEGLSFRNIGKIFQVNMRTIWNIIHKVYYKNDV